MTSESTRLKPKVHTQLKFQKILINYNSFIVFIADYELYGENIK